MSKFQTWILDFWYQCDHHVCVDPAPAPEDNPTDPENADADQEDSESEENEKEERIYEILQAAEDEDEDETDPAEEDQKDFDPAVYHLQIPLLVTDSEYHDDWEESMMRLLRVEMGGITSTGYNMVSYRALMNEGYTFREEPRGQEDQEWVVVRYSYGHRAIEAIKIHGEWVIMTKWEQDQNPTFHFETDENDFYDPLPEVPIEPYHR